MSNKASGCLVGMWDILSRFRESKYLNKSYPQIILLFSVYMCFLLVKPDEEGTY